MLMNQQNRLNTREGVELVFLQVKFLWKTTICLVSAMGHNEMVASWFSSFYFCTSKCRPSFQALIQLRVSNDSSSILRLVRIRQTLEKFYKKEKKNIEKPIINDMINFVYSLWIASRGINYQKDLPLYWPYSHRPRHQLQALQNTKWIKENYHPNF